MVLNLGKWPMGGVTVRTRPDGLKEVHVRYRDTEFTFEYMVQTFAFMESVTARMFFMAYKFREYDSKLVEFEESYQWQVQLAPERAIQILEAPRINSHAFLLSL